MVRLGQSFIAWRVFLVLSQDVGGRFGDDVAPVKPLDAMILGIGLRNSTDESDPVAANQKARAAVTAGVQIGAAQKVVAR